MRQGAEGGLVILLEHFNLYRFTNHRLNAMLNVCMCDKANNTIIITRIRIYIRRNFPFLNEFIIASLFFFIFLNLCLPMSKKIYCCIYQGSIKIVIDMILFEVVFFLIIYEHSFLFCLSF
jgi:hypothetical protein